MSQLNQTKTTPLPLESKNVAKQISARKAKQLDKEKATKKRKHDESVAKKQSYKHNQTIADIDRKVKRDEKFFRNNLSPGKMKSVLTSSLLDFQMNMSSRVIHRDDFNIIDFLIDQVKVQRGFEFQGLIPQIPGLNASIPLGFDPEVLDEVRALNSTLTQLTQTLSDSSTGKAVLNHTLGDVETHLLSNVNLNMSRLIEKLPTTNDLKGVVATGIDSLQSTLLKYSALAAFVFVVVSAIKLARSRTKTGIFQMVFSIALFIMLFSSWLDTDVKQKLIGLMDDMMKKTQNMKDGLEHQMAIDDLHKVIELASMGLFFFATTGMKKTGMPFVMAMSALPRFTDTGKTIIALVSTTVESVINQVRRHVLGLDSISLFDESSVDIKQFMDDCRDVADQRFHGKMQLSVANAEKVNRIWTFGNTLMAKLNPREKTTIELRARIREQLNVLGKIRNEFQQSSVFADSTRQVPTCVMIRGPSGVGKSTITMPLVEEVLAHVVDETELEMLEKHPDSYIYTRMPEQKFWDAYRGQPICAFDDFGQLKDVAGGGENEFSELIRAGNIFGYPLHMADLEAKGAVHFSSKMILATTNLQRIVPNSIVEPEAVRRRFDLVVDQVPKIAYCLPGTTNGDIWTRRLDRSKCAKGLDKDAVEFHVVDLKQKEAAEGVLTGEVLSYQELLSKLILTYRRHASQHVDFKKEKASSLASAIAARKKGLEFQMGTIEIRPSSYFNPNVGYDTFLDVDSLEIRKWFLDSRVLEDREIHRKLDGIKSLMKLKEYPNHLLLAHLSEAMPSTFLSSGGDFETAARQNLFGKDSTMERKLTTFHYWLDILCDNPDLCWSIRQEMALPSSEKYYGDVMKSLDNFASTLARGYALVKHCLSKIPLFDWYETVKPFIPIASYVLGGLVTGGLAASLWTVIRTLFGGAEVLDTQSTQRGNTAPRNAQYVRNVVNRAKPKDHKLEHQFASYDLVMNQIADKSVRDNAYEFWSGSSISSGVAWFVKENLLLVPFHFVTKIAEGVDNPESNLQYDDNIVLKKCNSKIQFSIPVACILEAKQATAFGTLDACIVKCPKYVPHHADITKYFMTHDMSLRRRDRQFVLVLPQVEGAPVKWCGEHYSDVANRWVGHETGFEVRAGYEYRGNFMVGHCGALMLVIDRTTGSQKIMGIHTGGDPVSGVGFATAITHEELMETLDLFAEKVEQLLPDIPFVEMDFNYDEQVLDGRFKTLAKASCVVHQHPVTEIRRSPLYGKWGKAITAPAKLRPFETEEGETIDPFDKGLIKYCLPDVALDEVYFNYIGESLYEDIRRESKNKVDFRILSFREAVEGIIGDKSFKSIPRSKSSGFPHNVNPEKTKGKYVFFGDGQEFDFDRTEAKMLEARCHQIIKDAGQGKRHFHVYCDYLKDERRPLEKVAAGKTRIFSGCPLELLIVGRMYFGAWTMFMTKNKINNGCAVGVNPYSHDWQRIAQKLKAKGKHCGAGDYSSYDGSEKPLVHWAILDVIQKFYNDGSDNALIREILWMEVVNSKHIRGSTVYEWVSSLPSGHFMTIHINNMYNHMAFRYAWMRMHDDDPASLQEFTKYVYLIVQGDDNLYSISAEKIDLFNQSTIAVRLAEMGLTYTDELKSGEMVPWRLLEEVTFLKRGFRVDTIAQRYVAPLSMDTILETPYWTKKGSEASSITVSNTNDSMMELALHGDSVFNEWQPKIVAAFDEAFPYEPLELTQRNSLLYKSFNEDYEF